MHHRLAVLLLLVLLGLPGECLGGPQVERHPRRQFLILKEPALAAWDPKDLPAGIPSQADPERRKRIQAQQGRVAAAVEALGGGVFLRMETLVNALIVELPPEMLSRAAELPEVQGIFPDRPARRSLTSSVPWIGTPTGWSLTTGPWTGRGARIAIVDSGIDYTHATFGGAGTAAAYVANNPTRIEPGTFPTARILGGTDFVGDDFDSEGIEGSPVPNPDPDPLDPAETGHGTHVAGIAAGGGVLTNGVAFRGPYTSGLDFSQFQVGPGVAPEAGLFAYKVFGRTGSTTTSLVLRALEYCVDPNLDGSYIDRVDVVNLSLAIPFGDADPSGPEATAIRTLMARGVLVVAAAGNTGDARYSVGTPGSVTETICVANSTDTDASRTAIRITAPAPVAGLYVAEEGDFTPSLGRVGPIRAQVVATSPADACDALLNTAALQGKIALIDRGTCYFVDKIRAAQNAGAIGVIMVNHLEGPPIPMGAEGNTADIRIPAVMISKADGDRLRRELGRGVTATLGASESVSEPTSPDRIHETSARGPGLGNESLKPDVTAPGTAITSARAGSGSGSRSLTGTSMAAPHVTGAIALLRQARPTWTAETLKAVLLNTSRTVIDESGQPGIQSRIGSGRIQIDDALRTLVVLQAADAPGAVSLSLGHLEGTGPLTTNRTLALHNRGVLPVTVDLTAIHRPFPGLRLTLQPSTLTIPGRSSAPVQVQFDVDLAAFASASPSGGSLGPPQFPLEAGGVIEVTGGAQPLQLPWHLTAGAQSTHQATASRVGLPKGGWVEVPIPTRGRSAHPRPLVSAFQLDHFNPGGVPGSGSSLVAAGFASDLPRTGTLDRSRLYFGVAITEPWTTPQYERIAVEVRIDTDGDEQADVLLINSNRATFSAGWFLPDLVDDEFMTLALKMSPFGNSFIAAEPLNSLEPRVADSNPFHNRMLVHSVSVPMLGLAVGQTRISYQIAVIGSPGSPPSESRWIPVDLAHPVIDPTSRGIAGTPWFDEGRGPRVRVDTTAARAAGFSATRPLRLLLLHAHGRVDLQVETVTLDLDREDTDGDRLPDIWELVGIGDLTSGAAEDPDRDGRSNAQEFAAGTFPLDLRLLPPSSETETLRWLGPADRTYALERATDLAAPFLPVVTGIPGKTGTNSVADPNPPSPGFPRFYRIRAE